MYIKSHKIFLSKTTIWISLIFTFSCIFPLFVEAQSQKKNEIIAVYPFTSYQRSYYDNAVSIGNAVETGFVKTKRFTVIERSKFNTLLKEDRTREQYTSDEVKIASKFGAKLLVLGHITDVSTNKESKKQLVSKDKYTLYKGNVTFSLKVVEVETGTIVVSESMGIAGKSREGYNDAMGKAMKNIDDQVQNFIGKYFPQRFRFMEVTEIDPKNNEIKEIKIWGGSNNGVAKKDKVSIYQLSFVRNPENGKMEEEKKLLCKAIVTTINGPSTSTCKIVKWFGKNDNPQLALAENSDDIIAEHSVQ